MNWEIIDSNGFGLEKAYNGDAGYDGKLHEPIEITSCSCENEKCKNSNLEIENDNMFNFKPNHVYKIPLNIKLQLPLNCFADVTGRSGLSSRGLVVCRGIVDSGYTGPVFCCIYVLNPIKIPLYSKICQILCMQCKSNDHQSDPNNVRGEKGCGSSD